HASLVVSAEGEILAERTHQMNDRLAWRLFGLIYAHPHPKSPDTTTIKNKAGLPLPTELTGEPVAEYLIDAKEQDKRRKNMQSICLACHSRGWVDGQFARMENTVQTTNEMTLVATQILLSAWDKGAAKGLAQKDSIFNEAIEKKWVEQWLLHMSKNVLEMSDWLEFKLKK
ncbi:MAG: hydroxylamine oxidase, partial [Deltaproteobacteria bacterium]|nr:hydroxylamine oxidase [Deltaproteobacteria bacterium]